jgi:hypothetical protein
MADSPGARLRYDAASGGLARLAAPVETLPADYEGPAASLYNFRSEPVWACVTLERSSGESGRRGAEGQEGQPHRPR